MRRLSTMLALAIGMVSCGPVIRHRPAETPAEVTRVGATKEATAASGTPVAPILDGLGALHHPITTRSARAQRFFDQGLRLTYAFNHNEAVRAFREAARLDPTCAMAHWGEALALSPNINDPMSGEREREALAAIRQAVALADGASEAERAYIDALALRYAEPVGEDRAARDRAYADAMAAVAARYPRDPDALTLHAASIMELQPWDYWATPTTPRPGIPEAMAALEAAIALAPEHPGAHHYYIHIVEASAAPERGVASADLLGGLMPSAGHLVHMPSHIYARVGRYADASEANVRAIAADEDYIAQCRAQGLYPVAYYPHNLHFLWFSSSEEGRSEVAIAAADKTGTKAPHEQLHDYVMLRDFKVAPLLARARFGRWDDILAAPAPDPDPYVMGVWHHARGLAFVAEGRLDEARRELAALDALARDPSTKTIPASWGAVPAPTLLTLASHVVAGRLEARRGRYQQAIHRIEQAVRLQDAMPYNEPPPWHQPVRHVLGAVLLEAGRPLDAELVYRQDLQDHRENGWALFGLLQSLRAQGKSAEADAVEQRFRRAWAQADVTLTASQF